MTQAATCEHGLPPDCPLHRAATIRYRLRAVAAWAVILAPIAAFWTCVWFGFGQPLLDAWRAR